MKYYIYIIGALLLIPQNAFASGNPIFLYSLLMIAIMHFVLGFYILLSKIFYKYRLILIAVYSANVIVSWLWALNYRGPNFGGMYFELITVPFMTFLCIKWLIRDLRKGNRGA